MMVKLCKRLIIFGIILFIVGVGILGGLFASGAIDDLPEIPFGGKYNYDYAAPEYAVTEVAVAGDNYAFYESDSIFSSSDENITNIDVHISSGIFNLLIGEGFNVTASNADIDKISAVQDGNKLTIEYKRNFIDTLTSDHANIILTVPKKAFDEISLEMDAGQVYISGNIEPDYLSAKKLDISLNAGELTMDSMNVNEFSLDMSAGNAFISAFNISDSADVNVSMGDCEFFVTRLTNAEIKQSAGAMYFNDCTLTGNTKIDMSMGDLQFSGMIRDNTNIDMSAGEIYMSVTGFSSEYSVITDRSAGEIYINGEEKKGSHTESIVSDPLGTINIDISAGDCEINFTEV